MAYFDGIFTFLSPDPNLLRGGSTHGFNTYYTFYYLLFLFIYCIVLYYSDLEHFCGFYSIQNKLSIINYHVKKSSLSERYLLRAPEPTSYNIMTNRPNEQP